MIYTICKKNYNDLYTKNIVFKKDKKYKIESFLNYYKVYPIDNDMHFYTIRIHKFMEYFYSTQEIRKQKIELLNIVK